MIIMRRRRRRPLSWRLGLCIFQRKLFLDGFNVNYNFPVRKFSSRPSRRLENSLFIFYSLAENYYAVKMWREYL